MGVLLGTMVGVLPGIGPTATVAMLLPITFSFEPVTALIMLAKHLLRRAVRRLDHRHPDQPAR
ncbi:tripartite tricarboxylate transporter permease [Nonomuraea ferruginea]